MKQFKNPFLVLFLIVFLGFTGGQVLRFQFGNGVAITLLDASVYLFSFIWIFFHFKKKFLNSKITKPLIFFITICLFSLLINSLTLTTTSFLISLSYLIRYVLYAAIFFIILNFKKDEKKLLITIMLICGAIILFTGFLQYRFYENLQNLYYLGWDRHLYRLFSTFLDPNFAGAFFVLFSLLTGELTFSSFKKNEKYKLIIYGYLLGASCIALFLTYSRSALIMFLISWIVMLILHKKTKWIFGIVLLLLIYFVIVSQKFSVEGFNLLRTVSSEERLDTAKNALIIFKDHPIFGVGFNTYRYAQIKYHFRGGVSAEISHADAGTDNSFLFVLATTGIVGFAAYLYLLYSLFRNAFYYFQKKRKLAVVVVSSLVGLVVDSLFINSLFFPAFMFWIWVIMGLMDYT